jgi:hypothetical protein
MDDPLRKAIWNVLSICMWQRWESYAYGYTEDSTKINTLAKNVWLFYFKKDLDQLPEFRGVRRGQDGAYDIFKQHFFTAKWYEAYNFLEFLLTASDMFVDDNAITWLNEVLEQENAAYRIIDKKIVEITDSNEIKAIKDALTHPADPVRTHINTAMEMLSDREKPDYRNSIKESISAVEAACRIVTGIESATLGSALKKISNLHPSLKNSFSALYGFTNDASGIRHSLLEKSNLTHADAKFMLVSCSAFVSYLRSSATGT